jgi:hypothetical protein
MNVGQGPYVHLHMVGMAYTLHKCTHMTSHACRDAGHAMHYAVQMRNALFQSEIIWQYA